MHNSEIRKFWYFFFNSLDLGFESKKVLFAVFGWYFAPQIRILLRNWIQEAKILRIRILNTGLNCFKHMK